MRLLNFLGVWIVGTTYVPTWRSWHYTESKVLAWFLWVEFVWVATLTWGPTEPTPKVLSFLGVQGWPTFSMSYAVALKRCPPLKILSFSFHGRKGHKFSMCLRHFCWNLRQHIQTLQKRLCKRLLLHPKVKNASPSLSTCWEGGRRISDVRTLSLQNLNAVLKRRAMSVKGATQELSRNVKCREENGTSSSTQRISSHFIDIVIDRESTCIQCQTVGVHQFQRSHQN
jgi:hypothetical protein